MMNKLSLKMKLGVGFGGLLLIVALMGYLSYSSTRQLGLLADGVDDDVKMADLAVHLDLSTWKQIAAVREFLLSGDEDRLRSYQEGQKEFVDTLGELGKMQLEP